MEYTKRRNLNRGYMKLEVWQRGLELFGLAFRLSSEVSDFKLKSQFVDAAQSVSANVAEGYGRRTLNDYIYFLYIAKGSLGEVLTRAVGLRNVKLLSAADFEQLDQLHYEVENKLLGLIEALETKRLTGHWLDALPHHPTNAATGPVAAPLPHPATNPSIHLSINPPTPQSGHPFTHSSSNPSIQ